MLTNQEWVFRDAKEKLGGKDLDLFVVNSFGSGFQVGDEFTIGALYLVQC